MKETVDPMIEDVKCVGTGATDGYGHTGGQSGHVCPKCGGMLLSKSARTRAIELAKQDAGRDTNTK